MAPELGAEGCWSGHGLADRRHRRRRHCTAPSAGVVRAVGNLVRLLKRKEMEMRESRVVGLL